MLNAHLTLKLLLVIQNLQSTVRMMVHSVVLICLAVTSFKVQSQIGNLKAIEVLASTPLFGLGQPREEIASNVQTLSAYDIQNSQAQNLADLMNHNVGSVHINDNQGNPFSVDLNYRGFTASPLLGAPQGLSVYMDGVRMNQPFGDVVNWELIPRGAIQGLTLIPGSNPLFGLNTLGGAISIQTKDGLSAPGNHLHTMVGLNNLFTTEFQTGGSDYSGLNWFFLGSRFSDGGWRDASRSDVTQLFTKVGFKQKDFDIKLTLGLIITLRTLHLNTYMDKTYNTAFVGLADAAEFSNVAPALALSFLDPFFLVCFFSTTLAQMKNFAERLYECPQGQKQKKKK
jgi:outer membrane cobalamin receptor